MNHEDILAVLPESEDEARALKEIAQKMGLDISSYVDWVRAERKLSRALRSLNKWGWVEYDRRQMSGRHRFWHNVYWKTEIACKEESRDDNSQISHLI
jgi:DNA-binding IclR family transcriptional regulator